MKIQRFSSLLLAVLITTYITPMAMLSKGEKLQPTLSEPTTNPTGLSSPAISTSAPSTPQKATIAYIPFVVSNKTFTPVPPPGNGTIANHTVIASFSSIPQANINNAAAIKTLFMHQSTGDNIDYLGIQCLAGLQNDPNNFPQECITYALHPYNPYDNRNWNWKLWDDPMANALAKTDQWVSVVDAEQQNYQVLGMKFCYVDGWNQDFDYYRTNMEQLEQAYPQKTFIWTTSALWAQSEVSGNRPSSENIQSFNQQLRAYALANHKFLYDLADIESHDSNGNFCQSNGIEALCEEYYTDYGGGGGGHPDVDGSIRLAKGFWWLMTKISGWNGN